MNSGKYIVIEGPAGVGKTTHVNLLAKKLMSAGFPVRIFSDPDFSSNIISSSIYEINEEYKNTIDPRAHTLLNNASRAQSIDEIKKLISNGIYCISDKNYLSNLIDQYYGEKNIKDYYGLNSVISFSTINIEPDLMVVLDAPVNILETRNSNQQIKPNSSLLENIRAGYLWEAKQRKIDILYTTNGINEVSDEIWNLVMPVIANRSSNLEISEPFSIKEIIKEKKNNFPENNTQETGLENSDFKSSGVTSDVLHIVKTNLSDQLITDIIKTASRKDIPFNDVLNTDFLNILNVDKPNSIYTSKLLVFENVSMLVLDKLLNENIFTIIGLNIDPNIFSKKNIDGHYKYYVPKNIDNKNKKLYTQKLNSLFDNYLYLQDKLKDKKQSFELINLLPMASKVTFAVRCDEKLIKDLNLLFSNSNQIEFNYIYKKLKSILKFKDLNSDEVNTNNKLVNYINKGISNNFSFDTDKVTLTKYYPKNELELLDEIIFKYTNYNYDEINKSTGSWQLKEKIKIIKEFFSNNENDSILKTINFNTLFNISVLESFININTISKLINTNSIHQDITQRYGYEMPINIENLSLEEEYMKSFDESFELNSTLVENKYLKESEYTVLLGHKLRWKINIDLQGVITLSNFIKNSPNSELLGLIQAITQSIKEVYPLLSEILDI